MDGAPGWSDSLEEEVINSTGGVAKGYRDHTYLVLSNGTDRTALMPNVLPTEALSDSSRTGNLAMRN